MNTGTSDVPKNIGEPHPMFSALIIRVAKLAATCLAGITVAVKLVRFGRWSKGQLVIPNVGYAGESPWAAIGRQFPVVKVRCGEARSKGRGRSNLKPGPTSWKKPRLTCVYQI